MKNKPYLVISKIEVIEKTDTLLNEIRKVEDDTMRKGMLKEIERKKRYLIEELLLEMIKAGFAYTQFKHLYEKIFSYLESGKNIVIQPKDVQKSVNRATQFLKPSTF